ncbi:amidohydrolase family protein [Zavarzinia sp. CC-PAN008]|uniref:amidohydrolase family protein n=1 Tax=Zavarzinia sp. CC-PAN008 TaxID=3243332 RepID=UPI003F746BFD
MPDGTVLEIPEMLGLAQPTKRTAQGQVTPWPAGTRIISADSHVLEADLWIDRFPEHLRDQAPRMEFAKGGWRMTFGGKPMFRSVLSASLCESFECVPGMIDMDARMRDLDAEGVEKELLFPQRLFGLYMAGDFDLREHIYGCYNQWLAELCAKVPDRLYGVMIPNYWNPGAAAESLQEIKRLGGSSVMVPINPRNDVDGEPIDYASEKMEPFWAAVEESGLPCCFHIGENVPTGTRGATGTFVLTQMQGFRPSWGKLTFGGVFDRHPGLRVVFVEGGLSWVASALHDADMIYESFQATVEPKLAHRPSWYWHNHCYATFMTDPVGLEMLHRIGADRVMWSSDYPHIESTFGYTRSAIQAVFDKVDVPTAQKILGGTALKLFAME